MSRSNHSATQAPLLWLLAFGCAGLAALVAPAVPDEASSPLRVCADPNNLPFSNATREGFENRLADLAGAELGKPVTYTWHAQRQGFIRETLNAETCDIVMGVPKQLANVITTRPYYRSTYVFVSRADRHLDIASIRDPRLKKARIGVQLIGDGGSNTPPSHALASLGMVTNLVGYPVYGDYREHDPPARIIAAVEQGEVDIAAVWGPLAGYFAKQSPVPLNVTPIAGTESFASLPFQYDIAMGVRKNDHALKAKLDGIIDQKRGEITNLLENYGIPLVDEPQTTSENDVKN